MRHFIAIISLLFAGLRTQSQAPGDALFNSNLLIHEVRITFPINNWYDSLVHYYALSQQFDSNVYYMATSVEVDGQLFDSVGCKFKGNSSYNNPSQKKSWKLDFEKFKSNNEIDGLDQLNLNNGFKDPSMLREKLCMDFMQHYGIAAPRCNYANVYVNNQLWGFFTLVEEVDKTFLKTHFGNKSGNLFKGDPAGNLTWKGTQQNLYYNNYELKTNEDVNDWSDLLWLIDNINNSSPVALRDSLNRCFNTAEYVKQWGTTILFSNLDSYTGSGHNYYLYHNELTEKFEWIAWDVNEAFGVFLHGNQTSQMTSLPLNYNATNSIRPLHNKMINVPEYWDSYRNFLCNALNDYFNPAYMNPIIDSLYNRIRQSYYNDPRKLFSSQQFDGNISSTQANILGIKPFVQERYNSLTQQLAGFVCTPLISSVSDVDEEKIKVFPNPSSGQINVSDLPVNQIVDVYYYDGQLFVRTTAEELPHIHFSSGVYHLKTGNAVIKLVCHK